MDDLHKYGERVKVFWPGGPYNFVIEFAYSEPFTMPGWEDWLVIHGRIVEPDEPEQRMFRGFYVHPVDGGYALLPVVSPPAPRRA